MKDICIVIPVYNEEKTIGEIVRQLKELSFDVVVINDGSEDNSGLLAQENGAHVLAVGPRHGKGFALNRGFDYAIEKGYQAVITMDGDGQHAISDLSYFVEESKGKGHCIITGNRLYDTRKMPFVRLMTNRAMSFLISSACRQSIPDTQCGFRYISCSLLKEIEITCHSYEIETEILMKGAKKGCQIYSVPVETIYRDEESHIHPVVDTIKFIHYFFKELFSQS